MEHIFSPEEEILHVLLLQSKFLSDFGLFNGKMGVAITFAHLYRRTRNDIYDDCMNELMDEILKKTYKGLETGFASGFSGIGWGIEYLLQNRFVGGNGADICEAIDRKIMEKDPRRCMDMSLETGFEGMLHYVLAHLNGAILNASPLPFDSQYLKDLYEAVGAIPQSDVSASLTALINSYTEWYRKKTPLNYQFNMEKLIMPVEIKDGRLNDCALGIRDGLAGILLKNLL